MIVGYVVPVELLSRDGETATYRTAIFCERCYDAFAPTALDEPIDEQDAEDERCDIPACGVRLADIPAEAIREAEDAALDTTREEILS